MVPVFVLGAAYLVGGVPFGYLLGRVRGVDLFREGSGNIGATNVWRVLGAKFGVACFVLDFAKGAGPVAVAGAVLPGDDAVRTGAAALAFLGHLFPVYLGFRGGKGVATGAGTIAVLVPGPAAVAVLAWVVVFVASRFVSLASIAAVVALSAARVVTPDPFAGGSALVTAYCLAGSVLVAAKHRANVRRLVAGEEPKMGDWAMRATVVKMLHVLAVGLWFGGAGFFNFAAAPAIFASFEQVVNAGPSDRTAFTDITPPGTDRKALASALAGSAVGPVFPKYFAMQAVCGGVSLVTAVTWWSVGRWHRVRVGVIAFALLTVAVGWPISEEVSRLRLERFNPDQAVAAAAKAGFGPWHLASLGLSFVTVAAAGFALALAAKLPAEPRASEYVESQRPT